MLWWDYNLTSDPDYCSVLFIHFFVLTVQQGVAVIIWTRSWTEHNHDASANRRAFVSLCDWLSSLWHMKNAELVSFQFSASFKETNTDMFLHLLKTQQNSIIHAFSSTFCKLRNRQFGTKTGKVCLESEVTFPLACVKFKRSNRVRLGWETLKNINIVYEVKCEDWWMITQTSLKLRDMLKFWNKPVKYCLLQILAFDVFSVATGNPHVRVSVPC